MTKSKADIMKLENEKAEKLHVDNEFKRVDKEISQLKDWCTRLEDMIKKLTAQFNDHSQFAQLSKRVDRMEDLLAKL
jgi:predicted nuclease with TOPRIM domain